MKQKDMKGQRFGHLKVIGKSPKINTAHQVYWICRCDCGRFLIVRGDNLRGGTSTQCSDCSGFGKTSVFVSEVEDNGVI